MAFHRPTSYYLVFCTIPITIVDELYKIKKNIENVQCGADRGVFWVFDELAMKQKRVDNALVDIVKNYMANKSFSRGVETLGRKR